MYVSVSIKIQNNTIFAKKIIFGILQHVIKKYGKNFASIIDYSVIKCN